MLSCLGGLSVLNYYCFHFLFSFSLTAPVASGRGLFLRRGTTAVLRASLSGWRWRAGPAGGAKAADAGQSGGVAPLHAGRWRRPALLLAPVCAGYVRLPALLPVQPPQPCGPHRGPGAGKRRGPLFLFSLNHLFSCLVINYMDAKVNFYYIKKKIFYGLEVCLDLTSFTQYHPFISCHRNYSNNLCWPYKKNKKHKSGPAPRFYKPKLQSKISWD